MAHAVNKKPPRTKRAKKSRPAMLTNLQALAESLEEMADHVASLDMLTNDEKETLRNSRAQLIGSTEGLIDIFAAHDALQMGDTRWNKRFDPHGPMLLFAALSAAFTIGSRAVENSIMKRIEQQANKAKTRNGMQTRMLNSKIADDLIAELGKPVWKEQPKLSNGRVADRICGRLNEKLEAQNLKPLRRDTIQRKIGKLRISVRSSGISVRSSG